MAPTSEFESRRKALIADIEMAFDNVSREDGTTLHEAEASDNYQSPEEQRAARRLDLEQRWQDVPDSDINACCSALSFLDAKGFRYSIPVFMRYGLRHWGNDPNGILSSSQYSLLKEYPKSLRSSEPASVAGKYGLSGLQSCVVAKFLRFIIDFKPIWADPATVQAVEKWEKFCAGPK